MQKSKIGIITVAYNDTVHLGKLLSSIKKNSPKLISNVVVVDNSDDNKAQVSSVVKSFGAKYVSSKGNIGFGAANNKGTSLLNSEYLLFLNPDVVVYKQSIERLIEFLDSNSSFAGCSPQMVSEDGDTFHQIGTKLLTPLNALFVESFVNKWFPGNPISKDFYKLHDKGEYLLTKTLPGSAFLVRKSDFEEIGLFDERFFMFFEEFDIGVRMDRLSKKLAIVKGSVVSHGWQKLSVGKNLNPIFKRSRRIYFTKHYGLFPMLLVEIFLFLSPKRLAMFAVFSLIIFTITSIW